METVSFVLMLCLLGMALGLGIAVLLMWILKAKVQIEQQSEPKFSIKNIQIEEHNEDIGGIETIFNDIKTYIPYQSFHSVSLLKNEIIIRLQSESVVTNNFIMASGQVPPSCGSEQKVPSECMNFCRYFSISTDDMPTNITNLYEMFKKRKSVKLYNKNDDEKTRLKTL